MRAQSTTYISVARALVRCALVEVLQSFSAEGPAIHALMSRTRATSANARAFVRFLVDALGR